MFARTTDVYSVDVKDGEITAGTTFDKIVKVELDFSCEE